jgi:hypothetical protein
MSGLSRAEEIKMRRAAARAAEEAKRLEAEAAAAGVSLESSLERSLERNLRIVHDPSELEEQLNKFHNGWDKDVVKYDLQEELVDRDFLDHGVKEPARVKKRDFTNEDGKFKKTAGEELFRQNKEWQKAYDALEQRFIQKACLAHDLRLVFDLKRKELKVLLANQQKTKAAPVRTAAAAAAASSSSSSSSTPKKKCGCKTKCSSPNCGCRRSGQGCSLTCGCGGEDGCANPMTHADTTEGLESFTKAVVGANSDNVLKERAAKPKEEEEDMEEEE